MESVPGWVWFGVIGLFVMARVGARISREVADLGRSLENLEVQAGEIQEHLRMIGRTLRLRTEHATVAPRGLTSFPGLSDPRSAPALRRRTNPKQSEAVSWFPERR